MEMFEQMNRKLDQGWKLTDSSCEECKSVVMFNPQKNTLVCISGKHANCQRPFEQPKSQSSENDFVEVTQQVFKKSKTDQISKKLGEKLIAGWAMLEDACSRCNVPIMRSKKGEMICFGCNQPFKREGDVDIKPKDKLPEPQAAPSLFLPHVPPACYAPPLPKSVPLPPFKPLTQYVPVSLPPLPPPVKAISSSQVSNISSHSDIVNERIINSLSDYFEKKFNEDMSCNNLAKINETLASFDKFIEIKNKIKN